MKTAMLATAAAVLFAGCGKEEPVRRAGAKKRPDQIAAEKGTPVETPKETPDPKRTVVNSGDSETPKTEPPKQPDPVPVKRPSKGQQIGEIAPEMTLVDSDGNSVSISALRGKSAVLVVFGTTMCPMCKRALPDISAAWDKFHSRGLDILEVFIQEKVEAVKAYAASNGLKHTLLPDLPRLSVLKYGYTVTDTPEFVLIARDGTVIATGHSVPGEAEIEKALK